MLCEESKDRSYFINSETKKKTKQKTPPVYNKSQLNLQVNLIKLFHYTLLWLFSSPPTRAGNST